ncbi:MAG TPA: hypothetical protein VGN88_08655, partial [Phycisphaerae bacterium]
FFLSEAAAAIVLEVPSSADLLGEDHGALAWVEETWIGGDGTALIAVDEKTDTLRRGLKACLPPAGAAVAFVHAHATGTAHDAFERDAILAVAGERPEIFSHKGWLGHSLGAAGLVSVALSAQCHGHGRTLTGVPLQEGDRSLTVAQGFGGHLGVVRMGGKLCWRPPHKVV